MTNEEWIDQFNRTKESFRWFIEQYFGTKMMALIDMAVVNNNIGMARSMLNEIWFELPDSKFNIIENPKGWREFLNLIED
jgi:hypothetical protein